jgi:hypothetical protein
MYLFDSAFHDIHGPMEQAQALSQFRIRKLKPFSSYRWGSIKLDGSEGRAWVTCRRVQQQQRGFADEA